MKSYKSNLKQHEFDPRCRFIFISASEYPICPTQFIEETTLSHSVSCSGYINLHSCLHHSQKSTQNELKI